MSSSRYVRKTTHLRIVRARPQCKTASKHHKPDTHSSKGYKQETLSSQPGRGSSTSLGCNLFLYSTHRYIHPLNLGHFVPHLAHTTLTPHSPPHHLSVLLLVAFACSFHLFHLIFPYLVRWPLLFVLEKPHKPPRVEEKEAPRAAKTKPHVSPEQKLKFTQP